MSTYCMFCCGLLGICGLALGANWRSNFSAGDASYRDGRLTDAERFYELAAREADGFAVGDSRRLRSFQRLASVLREEAKFHKSEAVYKQVLAESEATFGEHDLHTAEALNGLGILYCDSHRYGDAEAIFRRALAMWESSLGAESREFAVVLNNLGMVYTSEGRYSEAEPILEQTITIFRAKAKRGVEVGDAFNNLATVKQNIGKDSEADLLYGEAIAAYQQVLDARHPNVAIVLDNRALLLYKMGRNSEAETSFRTSLALFEASFGPESPRLTKVLTNYAAFLRATRRKKEAKRLEARVAQIREHSPDATIAGMSVEARNLGSR
jgi:tetratricopeptide (TPR) repeat protein